VQQSEIRISGLHQRVGGRFGSIYIKLLRVGVLIYDQFCHFLDYIEDLHSQSEALDTGSSLEFSCKGIIIHTKHTIFLSKARRLQEGDFPVCVQVLLVTTQDYDNILAGQHPGVCQPVGQGIVGFPAEDDQVNGVRGRAVETYKSNLVVH
jgi:hypothetical protein